MAANGILPHLLNERGEDFDTVICLALQVDEKTFASRTSRKYVPLSCNLNDKAAVTAALQKIGSPKISHVFWYAEANRPPKLSSAVVMRRLLAVGDAAAPVLHGILKVSPQAVHDQLYGTVAYLAGSGRNERNQIWMGNVLDALKATNPGALKCFMLGSGGKHYGMHLGPSLWAGYSCPFEEDKTRCPGPLSYFDAEDFIFKRSKDDGFTWNVVRPTFIIGLCPELTLSTQSFGIALATYALIMKAQGRNLMYPGSDKSFKAKINLVTSEKIAEIAVWSCDHPNQAYNCVSCPAFSWKEAWPEIAKWFGMQAMDPLHPLQGENTAIMMGEDAPVIWGHLQKKFGLAPHDFACLLNNDFLDKSFTAGFDSVFSVEKLKRDGFAQDRIYEHPTGAQCMIEFFERLVDEKVIPPPDQVISGLYSVDVKKRVETDLEPAFVNKGRNMAASSIQETKAAIETADKVEKVVSKDLTTGNVLTFVAELSKLADAEKKEEAKESELM